MYEHDVCDFCSDPKPVRVFNAPDFMLAKDSPGYGSRGGWMACQHCGMLIDAGKWDLLQNRAVDALAAKYKAVGVPHSDIVKIVVQAHSGFRKHMRRDA
jgi:hypothetical protein